MGILVWVTPRWEYEGEVEKTVQRKGRKVKVLENRKFKVEPQVFSEFQRAVDHARKHKMPLRLIKHQTPR